MLSENSVSHNPETFKMSFVIDNSIFPFVEDAIEDFPMIVMSASPCEGNDEQMRIDLFAEDSTILTYCFINCMSFYKPEASHDPQVKIEKILSEDWVAKTQNTFTAFTAGKFFVSSFADEVAPPPSYIPLKMNAGNAFGTGTHESTSLCLELISTVEPSEHTSKILDMGCGTGILSIALSKLVKHPSHIIAVDNDINAIISTRENAKINTISNIAVIENQGFSYEIFDKGPYHVIVANLFANLIIELLPSFLLALTPKGTLIISGILKKQASDLRYILEDAFIIKDHYQKNEWAAFRLEKK